MLKRPPLDIYIYVCVYVFMRVYRDLHQSRLGNSTLLPFPPFSRLSVSFRALLGLVETQISAAMRGRPQSEKHAARSI